MQVLLKRLRAIAEPNRMAILGLLHGNELCLCEIEDIMCMSQPRASQHLRILKEAGLVLERKEGRWSLFRINRLAWDDLLDALSRFPGADLSAVDPTGEMNQKLQRVKEHPMAECRRLM